VVKSQDGAQQQHQLSPADAQDSHQQQQSSSQQEPLLHPSQLIKDRNFTVKVCETYLKIHEDSGDYNQDADQEAQSYMLGLSENLAAADPERAQNYNRRLIDDGEFADMWAQFDPEELEELPPKRKKPGQQAANAAGAGKAGAQGGAQAQAGSAGNKKAGGVDTQKSNKPKKKIKYPSHVDPKNPGPPPDPERWLPKRERTEYYKKIPNIGEMIRISNLNSNLFRYRFHNVFLYCTGVPNFI
jgi:hypothetical protein